MFQNNNSPARRLLCLWSLLVFVALSGEVFAQAASIVFATGTASVTGADGAVRKAERGGALQAGETVDTGDGRAQLRFRDGGTISLQPATQFRIEQFRFAEQGGKAAPEDHVVMRFLKGALRAVSGLIGKEQNEQYRMDTAVGTIGIRGTEYGATLGDSGLTVSTYVGLVEVCNSAGCTSVAPGQTAVVPGAGVKPRLQAGGGPPSPMPGGTAPQLPEATPAPTVPTAPPPSHTPPPSTYTPPASTYTPPSLR